MKKDLKKIRQDKGISKEELARMARVGVRTVYDLENYKRKLKKDTFERIIKEINENISYEDYLMELTDNKLHSIPGLYSLNNTKSLELKQKLKSKLLETNELFKQEKYREALDIYLSLSLLFDQESCFLLGCAMLYEMLGEYRKAIDYSEKVTLIDKNNYDALYIKGTCLGSLKNYDDSIEQLELCLNIKTSYDIYYNLGVCYHFNGDKYKAIDYYEKCLEINNNFINAHLNIGICYLRSFNHDKCKYHIKKVLELEPDMYKANTTLGEYYRDLGDHVKAIPLYRKCLDLDSENYEALYGLFMCLSITGDKAGATFYSKKFFSLYSNTFFGKNWDDILEEDKSDYTFIGIPMIYDETGFMHYPTVGKLFNNKDDFNHTIEKIKDNVDLFQYFDKPLYIDMDEKIKVNIVDLDGEILVQINFGDKYKILELNIDGNELDSFIDLFNRYEQFRIHLECNGAILVIDCLKNITFKL